MKVKTEDLAFLLILFLTGSVYPEEVQSEKEQIAVLSAFQGEVMIQEKGQTSWQAAKEELFLFEGDKVRTKEKSSAEITFDYENIVELSEDSLLKIQKIKIREDNSKESLLKLEMGRVLAEIETIPFPLSKFEIRTPTAVAGARGTGFMVEIKDEKTLIAVFKGKVEVRGITREGTVTKEFLVPSNYETSVLPYRIPQIPYGLSKSMAIWKERFIYLEARRKQAKEWWQGLSAFKRGKLREEIDKYRTLPFRQQQEIKKRIKALGWKGGVQPGRWQSPKFPSIPYQPGKINGYPGQIPIINP